MATSTPTITIIGCGTPTPTPDRFGSAYVVDVGGEKLLFDCGPATTFKLAKVGISPAEIDSVFFTHHHFDHDADFPAFVLSRWDQLVPADRPLRVYGPPPTAGFVEGILDPDRGLFAHDWLARVHHPLSQVTYRGRGGRLPRARPMVEARDIGPEFELRGSAWRVSAARAEHVQPHLESLAYRLDTPAGSIVVAGDTRPCDPVTDLARDADILLMMCWEADEVVADSDLALGTCSIKGAAETAAAANVRQLVMVHIGERLTRPEMLDRREREARAAFAGPIVWGRELTQVPWP